MGQSNPSVQKKIRENIADIKPLIAPEDEVLDVGCFHGHMYDWLGHSKYTGIDLFQEHVNEARVLHPGVNIYQADLFDLTGKWDVVICSRVLMHIPHFEQAIEKLRSCCRKHLAVFIPIGPDSCDAQELGNGERLYFRSFPIERVAATGGKIIKHPQYSTVIYGPNLP